MGDGIVPPCAAKEAFAGDASGGVYLRKALHALYGRLWDCYGDLRWWPADTPYEVMVGAVLTQNTAWENVEKTLAAFRERLTPVYVASLPRETLADMIRPSGFYNQKAGYLHTLTAWYAEYGYDVDRVRAAPLARLRKELLALRGIGPETADSILLYAFDLPSFVVDAYTKRLLSRLNLSREAGYDAVRAMFTGALRCDVAVYKHMHAMIVVHAKTHCRAKPKCEGCPLGERGPAQ